MFKITPYELNSTQSPVVYGVTVSALDPSAATTDLGVGITGNQSSLNVGDTIKLTLTARNNGPNGANVKVNYKIPMGLKLLSSQGTGTYDSGTGIWSVGVLPAGDNATMELTLQVNNAGYFVNTATIIGDLHAFSVKSGLVKAFGVKAASTGNQASYTFTATNPTQTSRDNNLKYDFPPVTPLSNNPNKDKSNSGGPGPGGKGPGGPGGPGPEQYHSPPTTQLARDIAGVRDIVGYNPGNDQNTNGDHSGEQDVQPPKIPDWNLTPNEPGSDEKSNEEWQSFLTEFAGEVIFYAALAVIPNEYLQQVGDSFVNSFEVLGDVARYFGYGKQVNQIASLWERSKATLDNPAAESFVSKWSTLMNILNFNLREVLLEKSLVKIFPNSENEIKLLMNMISTAKFGADPFGTIHSIINVGISILSNDILDPKDLEKFLA